MMTALDIAIELSDLYEAVGAEGGTVAELIDTEILPHIGSLAEADGIGLGKRFSQVLDRVRSAVGETGGDMIRSLKEMMKEALKTYVKRTNDALTARDVFHHAIMAGAEKMLAITALVTLANALCRHSPKEAQKMVRQAASRLTGAQFAENTSGGAVGSGAIATVPLGRKKKRRKDSIFAEADVIPFGRTAPVQNPALDAKSDMTNVTPFPKANKRVGDYFVIVYQPGSEEHQVMMDLDEILTVAKWFNISKPDLSASMWYQPGPASADVPTMHIFHPDQSRLSPVEMARITRLMQKQEPASAQQPRAPIEHAEHQHDPNAPQGDPTQWVPSSRWEPVRTEESLTWDDLLGNATLIEVLREVADCGCERKVGGVMVDPTTAELVVAAHQALSPANRRKFHTKTLPEMVQIANRMVERGFLSVVMEEA